MEDTKGKTLCFGSCLWRKKHAPRPSFSQLTNFIYLGFLMRSSLYRKALMASLTSPVQQDCF